MTLGSYQMMLVVNEDVPAKTFSEFVEYARGHRPPLTTARSESAALITFRWKFSSP